MKQLNLLESVSTREMTTNYLLVTLKVTVYAFGTHFEVSRWSIFGV